MESDMIEALQYWMGDAVAQARIVVIRYARWFGMEFEELLCMSGQSGPVWENSE